MPQAAWQIADILSGVRPPEGAPARGIAYKTGTSYGYRDAWSVGFDGRYVLGVWIGRARCRGDRPACRAMSRRRPMLFEGFAKSGLAAVPLRAAPAGAFRPKREELPVTMERFASADELIAAGPTEPAPQIVFPPRRRPRRSRCRKRQRLARW